jgi:hypothetical protein
MATYKKRILSGSTNGRPIPVAAVATPGTLIHTALDGTLGIDEVWIQASNRTASTLLLTVEWGGATDPGDHLVKNYSIPPYSPAFDIARGLPLQNGLSVRAFASAAGIGIVGFVNRIQ